jgi:hypothetical protein
MFHTASSAGLRPALLNVALSGLDAFGSTYNVKGLKGRDTFALRPALLNVALSGLDDFFST